MAYDPGAINAALSAAVGDEPELVAELRHAFIGGATGAIHAMRAARDDEGWRVAATRLRGLAASFGAVRLMALAITGVEGGRDPALLGKLERAVGRL